MSVFRMSIIPILLALLVISGLFLRSNEIVAVRDIGEVNSLSQEDETERADVSKPVVDNRPAVQHIPLPESVKAIYMSACVAGTPSFRNQLVSLITSTELNAVMIDIKDYSGTIAFPSTHSYWQEAWEAAECGARDMSEFIEMLHQNDIFVIGRITVFQDPLYAERYPEQAVLKSDRETIWRDHKGLAFVDVASTQYWSKVVDLAVESYNIGFDELNFDYVRYPSDGNMQDIYFPQSAISTYGVNKADNLESFFAYLHSAMTDPDTFAQSKHENTGRTESVPYTSADLFGMTTTNTNDLSIGQVLERAAPYFDFIAPMVYPSHYPENYLGLGDPNDVPYQVVHHAMESGVRRLAASTTNVYAFAHSPIQDVVASGSVHEVGMYKKPVFDARKLRTWIQDFDYGGEYTAADVRAQIQASYDADVQSWMVWAPSNRYTRSAYVQNKPLNATQADY